MSKSIPSVGDTVYVYKIVLDFLKNKAEIKERGSFKTLGVNDYCIVINDRTFKTLDLKKQNFNSNLVFNKIDVNHFKVTDCYDEISSKVYTLNSNSRQVINRLKAATEKFINEKYGRYCGGMELLKELGGENN